MPRRHIVGHSLVCGFGSVHAPPLIEASAPPLPDIARRRWHKRRRPGETWGGSLTDASPPSRLTWRHFTRLRRCIAGPSSARGNPRRRRAGGVDDPDDDRGVGLDAVSESRRGPHVLGCRGAARYGSRGWPQQRRHSAPTSCPASGATGRLSACRSRPRASAIAGRHAVILSQPEAPWTSRRGMAAVQAIQLRQNGSVDGCRCARLRTNAPPEAQVVVLPDGSATSPRLVTAARPVARVTCCPAMCRRVRRFVREPAARDDRVGCHRDQRRGASWQAFYQLYLYIVRA